MAYRLDLRSLGRGGDGNRHSHRSGAESASIEMPGTTGRIYDKLRKRLTARRDNNDNEGENDDDQGSSERAGDDASEASEQGAVEEHVYNEEGANGGAVETQGDEQVHQHPSAWFGGNAPARHEVLREGERIGNPWVPQPIQPTQNGFLDKFRSAFAKVKAEHDERLQHGLTSMYVGRRQRYHRKAKALDRWLRSSSRSTTTAEEVEAARAQAEKEEAEEALRSLNNDGWHKKFFKIVNNKRNSNVSVPHGLHVLAEAVSTALSQGRSFNKYDFASALLRLTAADHTSNDVQELIHFLCAKLNVSRDEYSSFFTPLGNGVRFDAMRQLDR